MNHTKMAASCCIVRHHCSALKCNTQFVDTSSVSIIKLVVVRGKCPPSKKNISEQVMPWALTANEGIRVTGVDSADKLNMYELIIDYMSRLAG